MRRRLLALVLLEALLLISGLLVASPASACSCVGGTTQEFFDRADAVFTARLVSRQAPQGAIVSSADAAVHVFAVDATFKGTTQPEQVVLSAVSGASCGLELAGEGPFVVFGTRSADDLAFDQFGELADGQYAASLCGGSAAVTPALEAELVAIAGPPARPSAVPAQERRPVEAMAPADLGDSMLLPALGGAAVLALAAGLLIRRRGRAGG